ncbi:MAG: hypothetical protein ACLTXT_04485 [Ruminococcus callidus]
MRRWARPKRKARPFWCVAARIMWKSAQGHRRLFRPEYTLTMQAEMLTYTKGDANADEYRLHGRFRDDTPVQKGCGQNDDLLEAQTSGGGHRRKRHAGLHHFYEMLISPARAQACR